MESIASILEFWFGSAGEAATVAGRQSALWCGKLAEFDQLIARRFVPMIIAAEQGELDGWLDQPDGRLALILLTDQFPRAAFRDSVKAFAFDTLSWRWCVEGLELGAHRALSPIERVFFYFPMLHSEALEDQTCSVSLFHDLAYEVPREDKDLFAGFLQMARRNRETIERFGRFPQRNALLGRACTAEEREFLQNASERV